MQDRQELERHSSYQVLTSQTAPVLNFTNQVVVPRMEPEMAIAVEVLAFKAIRGRANTA